ncbi:MAG TPA: DUF4431 domain-containing protein [Chlamydiales bacterium]|nr:DUF4431 domain-containing protein [Chlamydiales bacterium]
MKGVLKTAIRQCGSRDPDGTEKKWEERKTVLVPDQPIVLSRALSVGTSPVLTEQISLPFIELNICEEFNSLLGKRVEIHGRCAKPFHFFDEMALRVDTALDIELQTKEPKTVFYEPHTTELVGTIAQKTYPGPPNYSDIASGDRPETPLFLALREPVNVMLPESEEDLLNQPEQGVREIQVVFSEQDPPQELWSQGIRVMGKLFSAHTGHHRRRVLMMADSWEPIDLKPTQ